MSGQRKAISLGQGILAGLIGIGICVAIWLTLGKSPDTVDNSTKVERGRLASDEPNPDFLMMQEHMKKQGK